jgi:hypothetical protein
MQERFWGVGRFSLFLVLAGLFGVWFCSKSWLEKLTIGHVLRQTCKILQLPFGH